MVTRIGFFPQVLERDLQIRHRLPTTVGALTKTAENQLLEIARQAGYHVAGRFRFMCQDRRQRGHFRVAAECTTAGEHFVEHRTEREDIRSRIRGFALRLLGRHVCCGAENRAFRCLKISARALSLSVMPCSSTGVEVEADSVNLASPKSRTFTDPLVADHDVARLEVAMKDSRGVGGRQAHRRSEPHT